MFFRWLLALSDWFERSDMSDGSGYPETAPLTAGTALASELRLPFESPS